MLHFTRLKIVVILLTCLAGFLVALPNFFSKETVASWPSFMPKQQLRLGLDLQGGAHLLLEMDQEEIKKDWMNNLRDELRKILRTAKIGVTGIGAQGTQLVIKLAKPEDRDEALKELRKIRQPVGNVMLGGGSYDVDVNEGPDAGTIIVKVTDAGLKQRISGAAASSIETVNRRVNNLGTSELTIVRQGTDRILIQFPGLKDTKELKQLIGETAKLTFHEVHPSLSPEDAKLTAIPPGYKIYPGDKGEGGEYLLRETPIVQGADLADAQPGFDSRTNEPVINFRFNQVGARRFANFTKDNVGRPFAIVLDDKVLSAPVIREPILGGSGQISGSFTVESTNRLAVQLRSGSLPAKLTIVEERTVGPSLGADLSQTVSAPVLSGVSPLFVLRSSPTARSAFLPAWASSCI